MEKFLLIEEAYEKYGKLCGICGARLMGGEAALAAHVKTHTGMPKYEVIEGQSTWGAKRAARSKAKRGLPPSVDVALVKNMILSTPAKSRYKGGAYNKGPLADRKIYQGMPNVFYADGRIRDAYIWVKEGLDIKNPFGTKNPPNARRRLRRRCTVHAVPQPHGNTRWLPSSQIFTEITTNLWTPKKFPNWPKPPGWKLEWPLDPTHVPQGMRQCELCADVGCDCIHTKVSPAKPKIIDAGALGEGVQATVGYSVGELIGELVGELVPLGQYDDGWSAGLIRDDLSNGSQEVCSVYCSYVGNWCRKVNHSCEPNVSFLSMTVSGKWRIMLQVDKAIEAGDSISVSYGKDYFRSSALTCLCVVSARQGMFSEITLSIKICVQTARTFTINHEISPLFKVAVRHLVKPPFLLPSASERPDQRLDCSVLALEPVSSFVPVTDGLAENPALLMSRFGADFKPEFDCLSASLRARRRLTKN
ncbi:hypothetical protein FSARC_13400 [Fusarium sarcochroum]|uniref:SET domain-containing protein n=1 Tax=Fusarium sarcochroum TaxID=1208366 RepID=A0A8H4T234_9HYPO|nr:hypothetical protein FSARC_13400 [Fusarium sarcochroum]